MFTPAELDYLSSQKLGRLATQATNGNLQNSPVTFSVDAEAGTIDVWNQAMGATAKFRNVLANGRLAFVVDDIASLNLWTVRCLEIRGTADALTDQNPPSDYMSREVIGIHPTRVISWGLGPDGDQGSRRTIS